MNNMEAIDLIKEAKRIYMNGTEYCMCDSFEHAYVNISCKDNISWSEIKMYLNIELPKYCYTIASEMFNAKERLDGYWWKEEDREIRIKYFDWLIEQYSNK